MNYPQSRQSNLVVQELENEVLIYDLKIDKAFCLNQPSGLVFRLCDGTNSAADISRQLSRVIKSNISEEFVWLALDQLKQNNLLDNPADLEIDFKGLNRRQAIRKVGLATIAALPVVTTVIAPTAAQTSSCPACFGAGPIPSHCPLSFPPTTRNLTCQTFCRSKCCAGGAANAGVAPGTDTCICFLVICD